MIYWIASYPKSGNTWLRMLLASWFADAPITVNDMWKHSLAWSEMHPIPWYVATGDGYPDAVTANTHRPLVHSILAQKRIRDATVPGLKVMSGEDVLLKTHSCVAELNGVPTINPEVTKGAIYVVRDPRDVCLSYAAHYGIDAGAAVEHMADPLREIRNAGHEAFQYPGTWSDHVRSWTDLSNRAVVRYEDLIADTSAQLADVLKYLGLRSKSARIARAVKNAQFSRLSKEEREHGFIEQVRGRFFRQGQAGGWQAGLLEDQVLAIERSHGEVMRKFGYEPHAIH